MLAGLLALANRSASLAPDFLAEFVLYALSATDLTILVALVFVLARNIVKLVVERRHALPFARFRAKLVAALLGMTIIPAVLVLIVGSELIRNSVDRWFNAPMEQVLASAQGIAADYYQEQQRVVSSFSLRLARRLGAARRGGRRSRRACRPTVDSDAPPDHVELVEVFAVSTRAAAAGGPAGGARAGRGHAGRRRRGLGGAGRTRRRLGRRGARGGSARRAAPS